MKQKISTRLSQPYPFYYTGKQFLLKTIYVIAATTLILYATQPFKVAFDEQRVSYFFTCFIHAIVAGMVFFLFFGIIHSLRNKQRIWQIRDEIIALIFVFIAIGIAEFLIRDLIYVNIENRTWHYLIDEVSHTFIIGILLSFIFVPINYKRLYQKNYEKAMQLEAAIHGEQKTSSPGTVFIKTQTKTDDFDIDPEKIIYVKSSENYVEVYTLEDGEVLKSIKRITLKNLLEQLHSFPFIIKTHRSYLINKNRINHITGNAQGYQLMVKGCTETIPVSRNFINQFNTEIQPGL